MRKLTEAEIAEHVLRDFPTGQRYKDSTLTPSQAVSLNQIRAVGLQTVGAVVVWNQAGDPGCRDTSGSAAVRQRQFLRAQALGAPRTAGDLDRLGGTQDDAPGRRCTPGRHERITAA